MANVFNASTSTGLAISSDTSGAFAFQSNGTQINPLLTAGTSVASTSGTSIDFTGIPSWAKRITVMFNGVSTSGTSNIQVQLGTSGGVEVTGYSSAVSNQAGTTAGATAGFLIANTVTAADTYAAQFSISNISGNIWTTSGVLTNTQGSNVRTFGGVKSLSGTLDRVRITTVNGTDTFDAGSINIMWE